MTDKGLFLQNVIAIIWDFDRTLTPQYMQKPLFEAYGIDEDRFWREVNALPGYYEKVGIHVRPDTCYLGHILSYVQHGLFPDLSNAVLRKLGARIGFFSGIPEIFDRLRNLLLAPQFREGDLRLEHYVVSTGLAEMIRGSSIASRLDGVWASEFIESPAGPETDFLDGPPPGVINQIACFLDNTTKTRALFEINKGVNKTNITVNDTVPEAERRVPFKNMIYIADGPSDIPSFSVVRKYGGMTYAVYDETSKEQFRQVESLAQNGRVQAFGPADYQEGSHTDRWLCLQVDKMARRILSERKSTLESRVGRGPVHIE